MVEGAGCTAQGATLTPRVSNPRTARPGCQGHVPLSSHSPPAPKHWIGLSLRVMAVSWCSPSVCRLLSWQSLGALHQFVTYCHDSHLVLSISLLLTVMAVIWCSPSVFTYCHSSQLALSISLSLSWQCQLVLSIGFSLTVTVDTLDCFDTHCVSNQ